MERVLPKSDHQSQNHTHLLQLAYQGDQQAITTLMNRHLKQRRITAQAVWEGSCLHILLEAASILPPEPLASVIHRTILKIQVEKLRSLKISFRQSGAPQSAWSEMRAISHFPLPTSHSPPSALPVDHQPTPSDPISLADWLNQKAQAEFEPGHSLAVAAEESELRFLRLSLGLTETALLPLVSIRQVVNVPSQNILPVPAMPPQVVGVYNFRGEMLWLVDLGLQLGFSGVITGERHFSSLASLAAPQLSGQLKQLPAHVTIVIQAQGKSLGLLVPAVIDIENHNPKQLQPPVLDLFPSGLAPFIQGYLIRPNNPVLDANALINDRRLQVHAA